jgi:hypothetical protein
MGDFDRIDPLRASGAIDPCNTAMAPTPAANVTVAYAQGQSAPVFASYG